MTFYTHDGSNLLERARIDSSGNLGLGVTPSAWISSFKAFDLSTAGAVTGSANGAILWANSYINASSSEIYKNNGYAIKYVAASDIGAHIWQIAPSGTAGNAITFTQAMTLDASGNLGVGTTSPATKAEIGGVLKVWTGGTGGLGVVALGDNGTTAYNCGIYRGAAASVSTAGNFLNIGGYDGIVFTASNAAFGSQTERARIDSSGNLLVGTTTSTSGRVTVQKPAGAADGIVIRKHCADDWCFG
ncbi:MAG: hypothetical protein EBR82_70975 [Caulobacteraceae bacterium]|nr:hypothetical protein [Caulobacteraceae bacterium]